MLFSVMTKLDSEVLWDLSSFAGNCENVLSDAQEYINEFIDYYNEVVGDNHDSQIGNMRDEAFRILNEISGALEGCEGLESDCSEFAIKREKEN